MSDNVDPAILQAMMVSQLNSLPSPASAIRPPSLWSGHLRRRLIHLTNGNQDDIGNQRLEDLLIEHGRRPDTANHGQYQPNTASNGQCQPNGNITVRQSLDQQVPRTPEGIADTWRCKSCHEIQMLSHLDTVY